jgi:hypothetical protein
LLSPAFDAEIEQVPEALLTEMTPLEASTEHPVDAPALKVSEPVPAPPVVDAVPVAPNVTLAGTVSSSAGCVAFVKVTGKEALEADAL